MVLFPSGGYWLLTKPPTMIRLFAELFGRYRKKSSLSEEKRPV
jgi:hypothetical protein